MFKKVNTSYCRRLSVGWVQWSRLRHRWPTSASDTPIKHRSAAPAATAKTQTSETLIRSSTPMANEMPDYLGISDANRQEVSGIYGQKNADEEITDKYRPILGKRSALMSDQNLLVTTFGTVRLDSDHEPRIHGQYDDTNKRPMLDIQEFEQTLSGHNRMASDGQHNESLDGVAEDNTNPIEDQYFGDISSKAKTSVESKFANSCQTDDNKSSEFNFIDKQYFNGSNADSLVKRKINFKFNQQFNEFLVQTVTGNENVFENRVPNQSDGKQRYTPIIDDSEDMDDMLDIKGSLNPKENLSPNRILVDSPLKPDLFLQNFELINEMKTKSIDKEFVDNNNDDNNKDINTKRVDEKIAEQMAIKLEDFEITRPDYSSPTRTGRQYLADIQSGKETPKYPHLLTDQVKNYRSELSLGKEKLDSKGYRVLSGQVFDYTKFTKEDIFDLLVKSILFDDLDIVAINKPYGMSIHTKESANTPVLTEYLPKLQEVFGCNKLFTVHRLDRDTTGVLLLAKTQQKAKELNKMFCDQRVIKRYICITRGVPDDLEGVIDIPIDIGLCDGKERMVLRPEALEEYRQLIKPAKHAKRAVTQYKVVTQSENAALVEVWPQTGIRHQIRVHLGFGLRCPILGDHKYSHLDRIAPQKLTGDMLLALNVRQSKVRHIPMHLHAKQYCLSNGGSGGSNIFINAPIPHHFHKNMSKLKLRP